MSDEYKYLDNQTLQNLLTIHQRNFNYLMTQASSFTDDQLPLHIRNQRDSEREKMIAIQAEMQRRGILPQNPQGNL